MDYPDFYQYISDIDLCRFDWERQFHLHNRKRFPNDGIAWPRSVFPYRPYHPKDRDSLYLMTLRDDLKSVWDFMDYHEYDTPEEAMEHCAHVGKELWERYDGRKAGLSLWKQWAEINGINIKELNDDFNWYWFRAFP